MLLNLSIYYLKNGNYNGEESSNFCQSFGCIIRYLCIYNTSPIILCLFFLISVANCDKLIPVQSRMTCVYKYDSKPRLTEDVGPHFSVVSGNTTGCVSNSRSMNSPSAQIVDMTPCAFPFWYWWHKYCPCNRIYWKMLLGGVEMLPELAGHHNQI